MADITPEFERIIEKSAPKNANLLLENFRRMKNYADDVARDLTGRPSENTPLAKAAMRVGQLFDEYVPKIFSAKSYKRFKLIYELNSRLVAEAVPMDINNLLKIDQANDQAPLDIEPRQAEPEVPAVRHKIEPAVEPEPAEPAPTAEPAPAVDPAPAVAPVEARESVETPTFEGTINFKSGHSSNVGRKPGLSRMPSIENVKRRELTGQVDVEGFGMKWRPAKWYKRFIDAANVLKFCENANLLDNDTKAWLGAIQTAYDLFVGLKDVPQKKWKNEIWKFIAADRKANALMIYSPRGALNFLLAFDRLLFGQPEIRSAAVANDGAALNALNISFIRMESGSGKTRKEKAAERRMTVRTYASAGAARPEPPVPVDPPPAPPVPATVPPAARPAPAPAPGPDPNVNTHNPAMDTSPDKLKFGMNKEFLDQYMMDAAEFPGFLKDLEIFKDDDISVHSLSPLVVTDGNEADEAKIATPELDKWITDLSQSDADYWHQFGVNWNDVASKGGGNSQAKVQENFDPNDPKKTVLLLFDRLEEFKEAHIYYFFDTKRPIALKLQKLEYLAGMRIYQYATEMNRAFLAEAARFGAAFYFSRLLLKGKYKLPLPTDIIKMERLPNDLWQNLTDPERSNILRTFRDMANAIAGSTSQEAENAKKWLADNKAELDKLP